MSSKKSYIFDDFLKFLTIFEIIVLNSYNFFSRGRTDLQKYSNSPSWSTDSKNVKTIFVGSGVQAQHLLKELKVREKKTKNVRKKRLLKFAQLQIEPEPLGLQKWFLHFWNLRSKTINLSTFGGLYDH